MRQYIAVNPEGCTGCRECEMVCSLYHFGECNPERSAVRVVRNEGLGLAEPVPLVCQQCDAPACAEACPVEAISIPEGNGLLMVDGEVCTGCGECTQACPAGCIFLDAETEKAMACDLCGGEPQCVSLCHSQCLQRSQDDAGAEEKRVEGLAALLAESVQEAGIGGGGEQ